MALISALTDAFPGPSLDGAKWVAAGAGTATIVSGRAQLTTTATAFSAARIETVARWDLTNTAFYMQVDYGNQPTDWQFQINVYGNVASDDRFQCYVNAGAAGMTVTNTETQVFADEVAFDPATQTWLRVRHESAGDNLVFEAATTAGGAWTTLLSTSTHDWAVNDIALDLQAQCFTAAAQTTYIDNFNIGFTAATDTTRFFQFFTGRGAQSGGGGGVSAVTFPRLGACVVGGPQIYDDPAYQADLAKVDIVIFGMYPGWSGELGETPADIVNALRAAKPGILLGNYTIQTETNPSLTTQAAWRTKLAAEVGPFGVGDWYLYDAAGVKVAPFPDTWGTNISSLVTPDANGDRWPQWKAKWDNTNLISGADFDIWYTDNNFEDPPVDADWNRDGTNDGTTSSTVKGYYRNGMRAYYDTAKALQPTKYLMANVDSDLKGDIYPGGISIPEYTNVLHGGLLESLTGESWSIEERAPGWAGMMAWYHAVFANVLSPKIIMFSHNQWAAGDYQTHRYMFASCLLDDGYYTPAEQVSGYHDVLWFDEYDVAGTRSSKWLGAAIDPPQMTAWSNGVYRRRFENGMALANPKGNGTQTVTVGAGYHRINGSQAPSVNNGAAVTSTVTLQDRDGLILVKD